MKNFIKLRSLLSSIPASLFEESPEADFLDWMLDGLKFLPDSVYYEPKIELFEIVDGIVQLPKYVKVINSVHWQCSDPSTECVTDLQTICGCEVESSDTNEAICAPTITYKMWLDSPYFQQNYRLLKDIGTDKSLISSTCPNLYQTCSETFIVTPQKKMYLSLNEGFISVNFDAPICDENGDILIPDIQILHEFLIAYAIHKHWEYRQFTKEEQARTLYQDYLQQQSILLRQARGNIFLRGVNFANLMDINGQYAKLIKLPEIMFYAR